MRAENYARSVQKGSEVRWDRLEAEAFAQHPGVLDPSAVRKAKTLRQKRGEGMTLPQKLVAIPAVMIGAVVVGSPVWGFAMSSGPGSRFTDHPTGTDPNVTMAVTAAAFTLTFLVLVTLAVRWAFDRFPLSGFIAWYAAVTLPLAAIAAWVTSAGGERLSVELWPLWVTPIIASAVLSGALAVTIFVMRQRHNWRHTLPFKEADELARRRRRAATLTDAERRRISDDLDAAIADLEQRDVIDGATATRARKSGLGGLELLMEHPAHPV